MQSSEQAEPAPVASRRDALRRLGLAAGGLTIASAFVPLHSLLPAASAQEESDEEPAEEQAPAEDAISEAELLEFLAGVELAAADAYRIVAASGLAAAALPSITAFGQHHREHGSRLAALAGATASANDKLGAILTDQLGQADDADGLLRRLADLETALAATHLSALGTLGTKPAEGADTAPVTGAAAAVASILPVESQHAAVLGGSIGRTAAERAPTFEVVDNALPVDTFAPADQEASS